MYVNLRAHFTYLWSAPTYLSKLLGIQSAFSLWATKRRSTLCMRNYFSISRPKVLFTDRPTHLRLQVGKPTETTGRPDILDDWVNHPHTDSSLKYNAIL
jgi:hypothetical protein